MICECETGLSLKVFSVAAECVTAAAEKIIRSCGKKLSAAADNFRGCVSKPRYGYKAHIITVRSIFESKVKAYREQWPT